MSIVIFFKEAGKLFTWVSSSRRALNALDRWHVLIGFASDEGVASSSAPFYPIYRWHLLLIFSLSSLLIFGRETVALIFVNSTFTSVSLSVAILEAVLLRKVILPVSSISSSLSFSPNSLVRTLA